jgi:parvulin-like peptidyl-prolyl isomerase
MYYDSHRDLFNRKPQYRLLHIAVSDSRKLEGLIFSLNSMLERTANADEAMISLANDFSRNDPLRKQWGDLGWVSEEQFPREFSRKVFLKDNPGKYAVFQFSCAYHLVMITGMREAKVSSLDEVRNYIKSKLIKERKREFWDSFIRKVFKKQNLKIYSFNLKEIIPESKRKGIVFPRGGYFP